ncbi:MAG: NUDIX hydrolase [Armatimonadota bacterium]|nr:NUDIX hydrolase [bacterium]
MALKWLEWARKLQAISQNGLTFASDPFDIERYERIRQIAAEIGGAHSDTEPELILDIYSKESGYATPKLDSRGVVFRDDRILLVREKSDGLWTLPGGWIDVGDSPGEAAEREVFEESGYITRAVKLLAVVDKNKHGYTPQFDHIYKLFFLCEITGGEAAGSIETDGVEFFAEDNIPSLSLTRIVPSQITRLFEHHRNPDWPADFD